MLKKIVAVAFLSAAFALPATAQTMNCDSELSKAKAAVDKMSSLSASAKSARLGLAKQAYDMCKAGNFETAKEYFRMMQSSSS